MNKTITDKNIFKYILLVLAVICIVAGVLNGGYMECLLKSMGICWECIGLG